MRITTKTGCTLRTMPLPPYLHGGDGVMLTGDMEQPGDGRHFEVALTTEEWTALTEGPIGND